MKLETFLDGGGALTLYREFMISCACCGSLLPLCELHEDLQTIKGQVEPCARCVSGRCAAYRKVRKAEKALC